MDLSNIPDLELRQKVKPLYDRAMEIEAKIAAMRREHDAKFSDLVKPLEDEETELQNRIQSELGDEYEIVGRCCVTGLPIFSEDEVYDALVDAKAQAA
jgi:hypothetical protein